MHASPDTPGDSSSVLRRAPSVIRNGPCPRHPNVSSATHFRPLPHDGSDGAKLGWIGTRNSDRYEALRAAQASTRQRLSTAEKSSYRQVIKASALIGGSSAISVVLGVVRTKVLAVLVGAAGVGAFGAYGSVVSLVGGIAGMGINMSGVRQIAEAAGTSNGARIARTALVLRRTSLLLGLVGMLTLLGFSRPIAIATFGNAALTGSLAVLSVTILFAEVGGGQIALVQGLRRLRDLAALNIWGALLGTVLSLVVVFFLRERGIVPFLVSVSILSTASSWWYARKVRLEPVELPWAVFWSEARSLVGLGVVFMASGLMASAVAYLTRVMVIRQMDLTAAGLYQAAWILSTTYVGFVVSAMGADYFPRLTAAASDHREMNRLANEQTEIALCMAVPGIIATMTFAPTVIQLLYSAEFGPAEGILRWQLLGVLGRVISWPIGFILPAKGCGTLFFCSEFLANLVHLILIYWGMKSFGLAGLGMAFFGMYVCYTLGIALVAARLTGFRWTRSNLRLGLGGMLATALVFLLHSFRLNDGWLMVVGSLTVVATGLYALRKLTHRSGVNPIRSLWSRLRPVSPAGTS